MKKTKKAKSYEATKQVAVLPLTHYMAISRTGGFLSSCGRAHYTAAPFLWTSTRTRFERERMAGLCAASLTCYN